MHIAKKLRAQNICGYVIYMFQIEDTIRAYNLDIERLCNEYLPRFGYKEQEFTETKEWYEGLIRMMHEENAVSHGHVQVTRNTIILLADRHQELLADTKQPFYSVAFYKALPYIVELRSHGKNRDKNEIENCLDAIYGATLLKMQGKELTDATKKALAPITQFVEMLSQLYHATPSM